MHYFWLGFGPSSSLYRSRSSCRCAASRLLETLAFLALALATGPAGAADLDYPSSPPPAGCFVPGRGPGLLYPEPASGFVLRQKGKEPDLGGHLSRAVSASSSKMVAHVFMEWRATPATSTIASYNSGATRIVSTRSDGGSDGFSIGCFM
jgi:hypothetical protein